MSKKIIQGGKVSELEAKSALSGDEYIMIQEGGKNKKTQVKNLSLTNPEAKVNVVQGTGSSKTDVMSQDSVSKEFAKLGLLIPRWFKDSLVCYYNPYEQYLTNEIIKAETKEKGYFTLKDLSPNHLDMKMYNFAGEGMSGMDGYGLDLTEYVENNERCTVINKTYTSFEIKNIGDIPTGHNFMKKVIDSSIIHQFKGKLLVTGLPDSVSLRFGKTDSSNTQFYSVLTEGINNIDLSISSSSWIGFALNSPYKDGNCDITITQLPFYANALVFDGIDDFGINNNLPLLTDFTVLAKKINLNKGFFAEKRLKGKGEFLFDSVGTKTTIVISYNKTQTLNYIPESNSISCLTPTSYNGKMIERGQELVTSPRLKIGYEDWFNGEYWKGSFYSFILFNRTLTNEEISWVKKNILHEVCQLENEAV